MELQFSHEQKVKIIKGFYKGYYAIVNDFKEGKDEVIYVVTAKLKNSQEKKLEVKSDEIRAVKSLFK